MPKPQQPELRRSGFTVLDPDSIGSDLEAEKDVSTNKVGGPVPEDNRGGHHPEQEQDKPDDEAFVARLTGQERKGEEGEERA